MFPPIPTQENIFRVFIFSCHRLTIFPPSTISEKKEEITVGPTTPHKAQWSVAGGGRRPGRPRRLPPTDRGVSLDP